MTMPLHETYMRRCLQLAALGAGRVAPNPLVGAVLVHQGRIIGEGYHQQYGQAHAEVNCLASVAPADRPLIPASTMYVSLEPCAHFGKTPPCADRLITERVAAVVVACRDPFAAVNGKGIEKLERAGIPVTMGVLQAEAAWQNRRFFTWHTARRPYVVLKWAQSADGLLGQTGQRTAISSAASQRLVHRWRSEEAAIMVGTQTALIDNPRLDTRHWSGPAPVRVLVDRHLRVPATHHLLDGSQSTLVLTTAPVPAGSAATYHPLPDGRTDVPALLQALYQHGLQSVLIEGGGQLLQSFIESGLWDEARVITNQALQLGDGVPAPTPGPAAQLHQHFETEANEQVHIWRNTGQAVVL